jgi:hypothetical protein
VAIVKITFWDIAPCSLVALDIRFRYVNFLHLQGERRSTSARLQGAISRKVVIFDRYRVHRRPHFRTAAMWKMCEHTYTYVIHMYIVKCWYSLRKEESLTSQSIFVPSTTDCRRPRWAREAEQCAHWHLLLPAEPKEHIHHCQTVVQVCELAFFLLYASGI